MIDKSTSFKLLTRNPRSVSYKFPCQNRRNIQFHDTLQLTLVYFNFFTVRLEYNSLKYGIKVSPYQTV